MERDNAAGSRRELHRVVHRRAARRPLRRPETKRRTRSCRAFGCGPAVAVTVKSCSIRLIPACCMILAKRASSALICDQQFWRDISCQRRKYSLRADVFLCLSKIKSEHIRGAIRRGLGGREYALPSSRCAIGARPYPRPSASASHYSSERKISESGADVPRLRQ